MKSFQLEIELADKLHIHLLALSFKTKGTNLSLTTSICTLWKYITLHLKIHWKWNRHL